MELPIQDFKSRNLKLGDLVILLNAEDLKNDEVQHDKGDIFQFIGGMDENIGCFIHCKYNKRTDFFADRTLLIKQIN